MDALGVSLELIRDAWSLKEVRGIILQLYLEGDCADPFWVVIYGKLDCQASKGFDKHVMADDADVY